MAGFNLSKCVGRGGAAAQLAVAAAFTLAWLVPNSTESAVANGDTRTIILSDQHTNESGSFTFMVNGVYDQAVLDKLNWFCRDWRLNEPTKMDPHLFDIIWEVYREFGSSQPIDVLSGYRSPQTNAMLRRRSRQVAEHSQHMQGKAIDAHFLDVSTGRIRDIAMRAQDGRRRILSDRQHPLGAYRQRVGPILAENEPRRADPAVPRRKDRVHPGRRPAHARL